MRDAPSRNMKNPASLPSRSKTSCSGSAVVIWKERNWSIRQNSSKKLRGHAAAARGEGGMLIVARTDARAVTGLDDAIERVEPGT